MAYSVVFTPEAGAQLIALYRYIETDASPAIAQRFTDAIINRCERFRELPTRSSRIMSIVIVLLPQFFLMASAV